MSDRHRRTRASIAWGVAGLLVAAGCATGPSTPSVSGAPRADRAVTVAGATADPSPSTAVPDVPVTNEATELPVILVIGDSNALLLGLGLRQWAGDVGSAVVEVAGLSGCGIGRGGLRAGRGGQPVPVPAACQEWPTRWAAVVRAVDPDVVLLVNGAWEVTDRLLPDDTVWRTTGDPLYDAFLTAEFDQAVDVLTTGGARVVWPTYPSLAVGTVDGVAPADPVAMSEPARLDRLDAIVEELAARRDDLVMIDFAGWLASTWPGGELDPTYRPDGVHFTEAGAREAAGWLGPAVLEARPIS